MRKLAVLVAVVLFVSGCAWFGGGRNNQGDATETDKHEVELGDFYFDPEQVVGRVGQEMTLHLRNVGATIHNWRVDEFNVDQDVDVGRSETVTFTPDQAGTFRVICDIPGHVEAGMVGSIRIDP